jgi:hypothetical protein
MAYKGVQTIINKNSSATATSAEAGVIELFKLLNIITLVRV